MDNWNSKAKRILKSELVKRGITNAELVIMLRNLGIEETKAGIDSKISRGTFSAAFMFQSLSAIGCYKLDFEQNSNQLSIAAEAMSTYKKLNNE